MTELIVANQIKHFENLLEGAEEYPIDIAIGYGLLAQHLIPSGKTTFKISVPKLKAVINSLEPPKAILINEKFGLIDGIAKSFDFIAQKLNVDLKKVYSINSCAMHALKTRRYSYLIESFPELTLELYRLGVSPQFFRKLKNFTLEDFIRLSEEDVKKIFNPGSKGEQEIMTALIILKTRYGTI